MSKLYDFLFLAGGATPAAWAHGFMRSASRVVTAASLTPRERERQAAPFPTDNWLRDDIGLPPLANDRPQQRLTVQAPAYFPTDDWLRDDIGLPPLGEGDDAGWKR
jgi:hypothetical protein